MPHTPAICCAVFHDAPDAIVVTDEKGRIAKVNEATLRLFRCREEDVIGHFVECLVPEASRGAHVLSRRRWLERPRPREMGSGKLLSARRHDGSRFPADIRISVIEAAGRSWAVAIVRDVTERENERARLRHLSTHDELTGLFNRNFFEAEKARFERGRDHPISVLVLDVDGLKETNDAHGHDAGDAILRRLGAVLRRAFRDDDVVARVGGDEFAVLLPGLDAVGRVEAVHRFFADLERHNELSAGRPLNVSVGGATAPNGHALPMALRLADVRMYDQKHARRGRGATAPAH